MSGESDSDEDFVVFGTPLDPLDEDAIPRKRPVTLEDQVAKDKHGRRRFHGAFTGGFSAGFFNTVGSLEGWKPSQFTSSRSAKTTANVQRPEDFMDDEDMDEFGIAPKMLRPTGNYNRSSEGSSKKRPLAQFSDGPIPGIPVLKSLIEPVRETIGIKLLMRLGWKPGQGVGPRLSRSEKSAARKLQKRAKIYGCAMPNHDDQPSSGDSDDSDGDEAFDPKVTFAPDDFEPYIVKPKDNSFGLGYSGLDRRPVLSSHINLFEPAGPSLVMHEKKKKVSIRGQAFGVGAFEMEDEDIYAKEDMSQYDFALDTPKMLAEKQRLERGSRLALPSSSSGDLEGFVVSSTHVMRKRYPPPPLPPGFTPHHQTKQSRFSASTSEIASPLVRLSANERAVLFNDLNHPSTTEPKETLKPMEVERTSTTFRPFVADPDKQLRYEKFLTLSKLGQSDKLKSLQPLTMTEWEQDRERGEFEQAARLYRPLSTAFSDRFVSASQPDSTDPLEPVERTSGIDQDVENAAKLKMFGKLTRRISDWSPHSVLCKRFNIPQPGVSRTTSMNSKTSRPKFSVFNFLDAAPFNVPTTSGGDTPMQKMDVSKADLDITSTALPSSTLSAEPKEQSNKMPISSKNVDVETLVDSTNKMDLYKAIFLSSSDESDGEDKPERSASQQQDNKQSTATELNVLRNTSPPRGIFANLDFDKLNSQEKKASVQTGMAPAVNVHNNSPPRGVFANLDLDTLRGKTSVKTPNCDKIPNSLESEANEQPQLNESDVYGPALPNNIPKPQTRLSHLVREESCDDEDDWVELNGSSDSEKSEETHSSKKKHKKKSSHRKNKKHKEKKHKHKKKKK